MLERCSALALVVLVGVGCVGPADGSMEGDGAGFDGKADGVAGALECDFEDARTTAQSARVDCRVGDQAFVVLALRGSYEEISYDHGFLMAEEIDRGGLDEIMATIHESLNTDCDGCVEQVAARAIFECFTNEMWGSTGAEFRDGTRALYRGYADRLGAEARYTEDDVVGAAMSIETYNAVDGLLRAVQIPGEREQKIAELIADCGGELLGTSVRTWLTSEEQEVDEMLEDVGGAENRFEFGCTGMGIPADDSADGRHIHARNLDADLVGSWNETPMLFLVDETDAHPEWYRYAAIGTAGLNYPGGISGVNEAGIAVSLHQMSTTQYEVDYDIRRSDIAPFVEQRILREASSIDEALAIVDDNANHAAWTIFISDAKTGEVARIELRGESLQIFRPNTDVRLADRVRFPLAQTNHFLHPEFYERNFDQDDAHFTYNFNKYRETRSRFDWVTEELGRAESLDLDWAIDHLAGHQDHYLRRLARAEGVANEDELFWRGLRAFGRTTAKPYGVMSSIVLADPDRTAPRDELWATSGNRLPASHSDWLGFAIDWDAFPFETDEAGALVGFGVRPLGTRRTGVMAERGLERWERSLSLYIEARQATVRPLCAQERCDDRRFGNVGFVTERGDYLHRAETDAERQQSLERAEGLLSEAIALAADDGIVEVPYHFLRARVRHERGEPVGAVIDWDALLRVWNEQNGRAPGPGEWLVAAPRNRPTLTPYQAALVLMHSVASGDASWRRADWSGRQERLEEARRILCSLAERDLDAPRLEACGGIGEAARADGYFDENVGTSLEAERPHFALVKKLELLEQLAAGHTSVELPSLDFITIE